MKSFLFFLIGFFLLVSQKSVASTEDTNHCIWCFHPFSVNIHAGLWSPLGQLNSYYNPSPFFDFNLGLVLVSKVKLEIGLGPILHDLSQPLNIFYQETSYREQVTSGGSVGGAVTYHLYDNKVVFIDAVSRFRWESIILEKIPFENPSSKYDEKLAISTFGLSFGIDAWFNIVRSHNFGFRILYGYAGYNWDSKLISNIGGQSLSTSLIYRFPKR